MSNASIGPSKRGAPGTPAPELVLYMFAGCPYCQRVLARAEELGVAMRTRDIRADPSAREELLRVGGRATVPCLFIDGRPLYESADILHFIEQ